MRQTSLGNRLFRSGRRVVPSQRKASPGLGRHRPVLESLEDRLVLSTLDLTSAGASGTLQNAIFRLDNVGPTGTGHIHSFVRLHSNTGVEQGYNTGARPLQFDENKSPQFTRNLDLSEIPIVTITDSNGVDHQYREFLLDTNQDRNGANSLISLDQVQIFVDPNPDETGYMNGTDGLETPVYDMQVGGDGSGNVVVIDSGLAAGSGQGDMFLDVPAELFNNGNQSVYLYSHFGGQGDGYAVHQTNGGFEEWAVQTPTAPPLMASLTTDIQLEPGGRSVTGGTAQLGAFVHDTALVNVEVGNPTPSGQVTYTFHKGLDGTGPVIDTFTVTLNGDGTVPNSGSEGPLTVGDYSFTAHYGGDSNYPAVDSQVEPLTITKPLLPPTITTTILNAADNNPVSGDLPLGSSVYDTAIFFNGIVPGIPATGTVTYTLHNGLDGTGSIISTQDVTINQDGTIPDASPTGPLGAGSYSYVVSYGGDTNYGGATSQPEPFTIDHANTSTSTKVEDSSEADITGQSVALGTAVHDNATVGTQVGSFAITGTVTYTLHAGLLGAGAPIGTPETVTVGQESTPVTLPAGQYSYTVHYSGDANYNASDGRVEPFTILRANTQTSTAVRDANGNDVTNGILAPGTIVHDTATVGTQVGSFVITGTVTYYLYATYNGTGTPISTQAVTLSNGLVPDSSAVAPVSGAHSYVAVYSGDSNYNGSTGAPEPFTILGRQSGLTLGYYSNKNGQSDLTGSTTGKYLSTGVLNQLFAKGTGVLFNYTSTTGVDYSVLVDGTGMYVPTSFFKTYSNVNSYLLNASATNMAYMLSAQLLTTEFNVYFKRVDPTKSIFVPAVTIPSTGQFMSSTLQASLQTNGVSNALGVAPISSILAAAIAELKVAPNTITAGSNRTFEEALKDCLDAINNNEAIFLP